MIHHRNSIYPEGTFNRYVTFKGGRGGGIHFVTERYWRGRGVQVTPLRNADKISRLVFIWISNSWKFSTWWKFGLYGLYFVYIFIADWHVLTTFCSSDLSFNGNILRSLYLKFGTSVHAQLCDYSFIHTICKFHVYTYYVQVSRHGVSWKFTLRIPLDK